MLGQGETLTCTGQPGFLRGFSVEAFSIYGSSFQDLGLSRERDRCHHLVDRTGYDKGLVTDYIVGLQCRGGA